MTEGLAAGGVVAVALGALVWFAKRMASSMIAQNKMLVTEALVNMKANTAAVSANTDATRELAHSLKEDRAVREERDKGMFKQLDRIERGIK
jgi:hypothetical protein